MGKIYVGQDKLAILVNVGADLSAVSSVVISGTKPDGTSMSDLPTSIEDEPTGLVKREVTSTDFTEAGTYILWSKVTYEDATVAYGEPFHLYINAIGT